jgi:SRSO17 transposase
MKAYQVYKGDLDEHGHAYTYELIATYLDKNRAFEHAKQIADETPLYGDKLEFDGWHGNGKYCSWSAMGWDTMIISRLTEIEITE